MFAPTASSSAFVLQARLTPEWNQLSLFGEVIWDGLITAQQERERMIADMKISASTRMSVCMVSAAVQSLQCRFRVLRVVATPDEQRV